MKRNEKFSIIPDFFRYFWKPTEKKKKKELSNISFNIRIHISNSSIKMKQIKRHFLAEYSLLRLIENDDGVSVLPIRLNSSFIVKCMWSLIFICLYLSVFFSSLFENLILLLSIWIWKKFISIQFVLFIIFTSKSYKIINF